MPPEQQAPSFWQRCNQVTWYSKLGAVIVFLGIVPALSFYIGTQYQLLMQISSPPQQTPVVAQEKKSEESS